MKKALINSRLLLYVAFLAVFAIVPTAFFENHSLCFFRSFAGVLCPGCGVTRGFSCFMHLDFASAFRYNEVFAAAVFPVSVFLMAEDTAVILVRIFFSGKKKSLVERGFVAIKELVSKKRAA